MYVDASRMMPITEVFRSFGKKIKEVAETDKPIFLVKKNKIVAVLVSKKEYETLIEKKITEPVRVIKSKSKGEAVSTVEEVVNKSEEAEASESKSEAETVSEAVVSADSQSGSEAEKPAEVDEVSEVSTESVPSEPEVATDKPSEATEQAVAL